MKTAKEAFDELGGREEPAPLERLRFFCALAMDGQDWLDLEAFLDDVKACMTTNAEFSGRPKAGPLE